MKKLFLYMLFGLIAQLTCGVILSIIGVKEYYVGAWSEVVYFAIALYPIYKNYINQ